MYAIFTISGKQYKAEPGDELSVDFINDAEKDTKLKFDQVLLCSDGTQTHIGTPYLNASVEATVLKQYRDRKLIVFKKKRRVDYHKKIGHRQRHTLVRIDAVNL